MAYLEQHYSLHVIFFSIPQYVFWCKKTFCVNQTFTVHCLFMLRQVSSKQSISTERLRAKHSRDVSLQTPDLMLNNLVCSNKSIQWMILWLTHEDRQLAPLTGSKWYGITIHTFQFSFSYIYSSARLYMFRELMMHEILVLEYSNCTSGRSN